MKELYIFFSLAVLLFFYTSLIILYSSSLFLCSELEYLHRKFAHNYMLCTKVCVTELFLVWLCVPVQCILLFQLFLSVFIRFDAHSIVAHYLDSSHSLLFYVLCVFFLLFLYCFLNGVVCVFCLLFSVHFVHSCASSVKLQKIMNVWSHGLVDFCIRQTRLSRQGKAYQHGKWLHLKTIDTCQLSKFTHSERYLENAISIAFILTD